MAKNVLVVERFKAALLIVLLLNVLPLPRAPVDYDKTFKQFIEPVAIGLGFPFSYFKFYIGQGPPEGDIGRVAGEIELLPFGIIFNVFAMALTLPLGLLVAWATRSDVQKIKVFMRENKKFHKALILYTILLLGFSIYYMMLLPSTPEGRCKSMAFRQQSLCYFQLAAEMKDPKFCEKGRKYAWYATIQECYLNLAVKTQDPRYCEPPYLVQEYSFGKSTQDCLNALRFE